MHAQDWPQFLGPTRNSKYAPTDVTTVFPKAGPPLVWKKAIGQGFSTPVVADGKLILFHRLRDKETVECLDAATGKEIWRFDYPTRYRDDFGFDEGPRSTPSISAGRVYTFGAEGVLHCLDFATGKKVWAVDTYQQFDVRKGFLGPPVLRLSKAGLCCSILEAPSLPGWLPLTATLARCCGPRRVTKPAIPRR